MIEVEDSGEPNVRIDLSAGDRFKTRLCTDGVGPTTKFEKMETEEPTLFNLILS